MDAGVQHRMRTKSAGDFRLDVEMLHGRARRSGPSHSPGLEPLNPRPHLDLPGPCTARLAEQVEIAFGDRIGIEHRIRLVRWFGAAGIANAAVDDDVADVN